MIERLLVAVAAVALYDWIIKPQLEQRQEREERNRRFVEGLFTREKKEEGE